MRNRVLLAVPLLLLVAAGPALPIKPGKWETTVVVDDMSMPNVPAFLAKRMVGHTTTVSACVTPEQAADGPKAVLANTRGKCHYTSFNATGGKFDATLECAMGSGTMTSTSTGTYTATTLETTSSSVATGPRGMTTKSHTSGRYTGPC